MKYLTLLLPLLAVGQLSTLDPKNLSSPFLTTTLEQLDGSRVSLRYRAVHWDPIVTTAVFEEEETSNYYNQFVLPDAAELETNVQVAIGANRLNPGRYTLGLEAQTPDQSTLLISDENQVVLRIPLSFTLEQGTVPHLSVVFTPGVTDRDFVLNALYGNYSFTQKWRFSGVPARPVDIAESVAQRANADVQRTAVPLQSQTQSVPLQNPVQSALDSTNQANPLPAGSGASLSLPSSTVADPKVVGGLTPFSAGGEGTAAAASPTARNATALFEMLQNQAGSGAFRALNIQP